MGDGGRGKDKYKYKDKYKDKELTMHGRGQTLHQQMGPRGSAICWTTHR